MAASALPPQTLLRRFDTCRLIPSRFAEREDAVLGPLAGDSGQLRDLFELDNATNLRLIAEFGRAPGIGIDELVFGVPNFRMINAAFTYARPEGSRFNDGERGAWYCAFDMQTALAEVAFHKTVEYQEIARFDDSVGYQALLADFSAEFHDLRPRLAGAQAGAQAGANPFDACLDPRSYIASQQLAATLLEAGSMGVVFPSVRRAGGTSLACFRPALVGNVRKGDSYRLTWRGTPVPRVEAL